MTTEGRPTARELREKLALIGTHALEEVNNAHSLRALEDVRVLYLGRRAGSLTTLLRDVGRLALAEERRSVGAEANPLRQVIEDAIAARKLGLEMDALRSAAGVREKHFDVTLPGRVPPQGRLHPTTQTIREIAAAFGALGFQVMEGPEVEWDRYNFEALNIPQDHPARDMWDTIWVDYTDAQGQRPLLLRTHTSPMQVRIMERSRPPVRVIVPGRVYRYEALDATHESIFFQVEGLAVDEGLTFAQLKGTLAEFAKRMFGAQRKVRFRCDYFPFVEPGVDMSIDCFVCAPRGSSEGCRICKGTGWIEIMGAGMVHPEVLRGVNVDPERYSGFAFGLGVERVAMLKHGIDDVRLFYSNDPRFLRQF